MDNTIVDKLLKATDMIASAKANSLQYDKTVIATIEDTSNADKGEYIVNDGSSSWKAYSENKEYVIGTRVYITIPNGDYNNQKIIIGKYTSESSEYYTYINPTKNFINVTGNCITIEMPDFVGITANNPNQIQTRIWDSGSILYRGYQKIALIASFKTWLPTVQSGSYGLILQIEETTEDNIVNSYNFELGINDMLGNIYNFETFYKQEKLFDIEGLQTITRMQLYFYQLCDFLNSENELIPYKDNDNNILPSNIFVNNPDVSIGYDLSDFNKDTVLLNTVNEDKNYSKEITNKDLYTRWIHLENTEKPVCIQNIEETPENTKVHWYTYDLNATKEDMIAGKYWKEIPDSLNNFNLSYSPNQKLQRDRLKVVIESPSYESISESFIDNKYLEESKNLILEEIEYFTKKEVILPDWGESEGGEIDPPEKPLDDIKKEGNLVSIIKDNRYDYIVSVVGDINNKKTYNEFHDSDLESNGWELIMSVNGGLFYTQDSYHYACGAEKSRWVVNQGLDKNLNGSMLFLTQYNGNINFIRQTDEWCYDLNNSDCYGALNCMGVLHNGERVNWGYGNNDGIDKNFFNSQWNTISGRTVVGTDVDGNYLVYSLKGVTGNSGLYGNQLYNICESLGFYNCICLDGGGSVFRIIENETDIATDGRLIKNAILFYRKKKDAKFLSYFKTPKETNKLIYTVSPEDKKIIDEKFKKLFNNLYRLGPAEVQTQEYDFSEYLRRRELLYYCYSIALAQKAKSFTLQEYLELIRQPLLKNDANDITILATNFQNYYRFYNYLELDKPMILEPKNDNIEEKSMTIRQALDMYGIEIDDNAIEVLAIYQWERTDEKVNNIDNRPLAYQAPVWKSQYLDEYYYIDIINNQNNNIYKKEENNFIKADEEYDKYLTSIKGIINTYFDIIWNAKEGCKLYESEILTLENLDPIDEENAADLVNALTITCDEEGYGGVYRIYDSNNNIRNNAESLKLRKITATYKSTVDDEDTLKDAERVIWEIPIYNSMIKIPQKNKEFEEIDRLNGVLIVSYDSEGIDLAQFDEDGIIIPNGHEYIYIIRTNLNEEGASLGSESDVSVTQLFRIKDYYSQINSNNIITCIVEKQNKVYKASKELIFGTNGANGTDASFVIRYTDISKIAMFPGEKNVKVEAFVYDYENNELNDTTIPQLKEIKWSWFTTGSNKLSMSSTTGKQIELNHETTSGVIDSDCYYFILQAETKYGDTPIVAYFPIAFQDTIENNNIFRFEGPNQIIYNSAGNNPEYYKKPYNIYLKDTIYKTGIGWQDEYLDVEQTKYVLAINLTEQVFNSNPNIYYLKDEYNNYYLAGTFKEYEDDLDENGEKIRVKYYIKKTNEDPRIDRYYPNIEFDGENYNLKPCSQYWTSSDDKPQRYMVIGRDAYKIYWAQPILIIQNRYPSAMLNQWDGSLQIDEENGTILSTMVGAGIKNEDNTFSGVLMGDVKSYADNAAEKGLYGYNHGAQSFAFKIDGTATIGKAGKGQIYFDGNKGTIQSGNYVKMTSSKIGSGMLIDLDDSKLNAYGIAGGFELNMESDNALLKIKSKNNNNLLLISNDNYYLQTDNYDTSNHLGTKIDLEKGKITSYDFTIKAYSPDLKTITIDSGASTYPFNINNNFRIKWDGGFNVNNNFSVDANGNITANNAHLNNAYVQGEVHADSGTLGDLTVNGTLTGGTIKGTTIIGGIIQGASIDAGGFLGSGWNGSGYNFTLDGGGNITTKGSITASGNVSVSGYITCAGITVNGSNFRPVNITIGFPRYIWSSRTRTSRVLGGAWFNPDTQSLELNWTTLTYIDGLDQGSCVDVTWHTGLIGNGDVVLRAY